MRYFKSETVLKFYSLEARSSVLLRVVVMEGREFESIWVQKL